MERGAKGRDKYCNGGAKWGQGYTYEEVLFSKQVSSHRQVQSYNWASEREVVW